MGTLIKIELCPPEIVPWALELADLAPEHDTVVVAGYPAPSVDHPEGAVITWTVFSGNGEVVGFYGAKIEKCGVYVDPRKED